MRKEKRRGEGEGEGVFFCCGGEYFKFIWRGKKYTSPFLRKKKKKKGVESGTLAVLYLNLIEKGERSIVIIKRRENRTIASIAKLCRKGKGKKQGGKKKKEYYQTELSR